MINLLKAVEFKIPDDNILQQKSNSLRIINSLCASEIRFPLSYLFFLNSVGRYIADAFLIELNDKFFFIATESVLNNLINHLKSMDIRKQMQFSFSNLFVYQIVSNFSSNDDICVFKDPFEIGNLVVSKHPLILHQEIDFAQEKKLYLNSRIQKEIAIFDDFELARSVVPEYGLVSKFISYNKGCYLGQELMQRVRTQGMVRKTVKCLHSNRIDDNSNVLQVLSENDNHCLALVKI